MKEITVTSSFYAYLSRLRWIKRWGLKRNAHEENVMEHSWEVSVIAHTLALIKNRYYGGNVDANAIATAALYHDITEVITGDLPTPIKYHSKEINTAYKQIEKQAELELLALLPAELYEDFQALIHHDKMPEEHVKIIKAADKISAYLKCQAELKAVIRNLKPLPNNWPRPSANPGNRKSCFLCGLCAQLRLNTGWIDENELRKFSIEG